MMKRDKRTMKKGRRNTKKIRIWKRVKYHSPYHPTFCTTGTNTNPFTSKWDKVLGGGKKKKLKKKDTL